MSDAAKVIEKALLRVARNVMKHMMNRDGHCDDDECFQIDLRLSERELTQLVEEKAKTIAAILIAENDRLKRGDFTEEEFQNLCHNFSEDDACRFRKGCEQYQEKLFGKTK